MIENKAKIKSGAPKRNPVCYQTLQDIVIPAGTILRADIDLKFSCGIAGGYFQIGDEANDHKDIFKKVIA